MKKILAIITLCVLALTGTLSAQSNNTSNFRFGAKVGVDLFTPTVDQNAIKSQIATNWQAGVLLQFGRKVFFQPEVYYATQKEEAVSGATTVENKVDRIKVPVMLGARLLNLKVVSVHLMAGPQATFLMNEEMPNLANPRPKTSYALLGGAGVDIIGLITADIRYSVDLNENTNAQIKQLKWDSGVNVTVGIKF